ncbi:integrase family protein [Rhodomicrobium vannielii ATCC 17100]|uniref:Integrase family protein n=1 Tax=Rhodomicrobium vannielii (strain ATCC 17100 / DSM 162 / LMG 4299 / NCIMB 10020 / ATH 3.1.1) TaxID=648757 RepID=E3HZG1_RHOVT|nr:site-specific integrase [Rhodomicrobium vannielii]ADP70996.1 integrase family protein [Rhodomicrobium vannielii ATCC 17100]
MGTILPRKRKDGSIGYIAQIFIKREGKRHREARTFDRKQAAAAWIKKRETEISRSDALFGVSQTKRNALLRDAINRYVAESRKEIGRTKAQVLNAIKTFDIADMPCADIRSQDIVEFATMLSSGRTPQTVANYLSHLSAVFRIANPAWGYALDPQAMKNAFVVTTNLGLTGKSRARDRRPTIAELHLILDHFTKQRRRAPQAAPMAAIAVFALFSTRRQEEIVRIQWKDLDRDSKRVLVRDMKHPGEKIGNDVWVDIPDHAFRVIEAMPRKDERIFPYSTDAVSSAFTRAGKLLGIDDLNFHDLRHEGVSRLFEMGWSIPRVAAVSGHRSWQSLKRYTHLRQAGDKYEEWPWLDRVCTDLIAHERER